MNESRHDEIELLRMNNAAYKAEIDRQEKEIKRLEAENAEMKAVIDAIHREKAIAKYEKKQQSEEIVDDGTLHYVDPRPIFTASMKGQQ